VNGTSARLPSRYRGRFAPSPTGPLHFGSLVAALASYCDARAAGGEWLLRIDDVDEPRSRPQAKTTILTTLERYGFAWDGEVVHQSERTALYAAALAQLAARGLAYECACTRRELERSPVGAGGERMYPGTCSDGIPADRSDRPQRAWRARRRWIIDYRDRLRWAPGFARGSATSSCGAPTGSSPTSWPWGRRAAGNYPRRPCADLLASTPRQIFLQQLLGYPTPSYLHVPIAVDAAGEKLSKQTRAEALRDDDALPTLLSAWRFLDQPGPSGSGTPGSVGEFWPWAFAMWSPARLPPVRMLPAPIAAKAKLRDRV
jgi:glutamyl-Q tRNA(Asp) synthetase